MAAIKAANTNANALETKDVALSRAKPKGVSALPDVAPPRSVGIRLRRFCFQNFTHSTPSICEPCMIRIFLFVHSSEWRTRYSEQCAYKAASGGVLRASPTISMAKRKDSKNLLVEVQLCCSGCEWPTLLNKQAAGSLEGAALKAKRGSQRNPHNNAEAVSV